MLVSASLLLFKCCWSSKLTLNREPQKRDHIFQFFTHKCHVLPWTLQVPSYTHCPLRTGGRGGVGDRVLRGPSCQWHLSSSSLIELKNTVQAPIFNQLMNVLCTLPVFYQPHWVARTWDSFQNQRGTFIIHFESKCFELIGVWNNYSQKSDYIVTLFLLYNFLLLHRPCFGTFILGSFQWTVCVLLYINLQENNDAKHTGVICFDIFNIWTQIFFISCLLQRLSIAWLSYKGEY